MEVLSGFPDPRQVHREPRVRYREVTWNGEKAEGVAELYGVATQFKGSLNLMLVDYAIECFPEQAGRLIRLADGMGSNFMSGDWSHIRDSSPEAKAAMFAEVKRILAKVPIPFVVGLRAASTEHITVLPTGLFHPKCFNDFSNDVLRGLQIRPEWQDLLTEWPAGESCWKCNGTTKEGPAWE
jgi:hypothetical protein